VVRGGLYSFRDGAAFRTSIALTLEFTGFGQWLVVLLSLVVVGSVSTLGLAVSALCCSEDATPFRPNQRQSVLRESVFYAKGDNART
jgi:hypothetical protein